MVMHIVGLTKICRIIWMRNDKTDKGIYDSTLVDANQIGVVSCSRGIAKIWHKIQRKMVHCECWQTSEKLCAFDRMKYKTASTWLRDNIIWTHLFLWILISTNYSALKYSEGEVDVQKTIKEKKMTGEGWIIVILWDNRTTVKLVRVTIESL